MTKSDRLLIELSLSVKAGGGVHTASELAFMLGVQKTPAFTKFLADCVKKGTLRRLASGVFESVVTPPEPSTAIYKVVKKLRSGVLNYISLESQLSYTGDISQIVIGRLTVMSKGRNGIFTTPYGVIEFIHTKKPVDTIMPALYLDSDINMYRAKSTQAISDLKSCKRNLHMLEC